MHTLPNTGITVPEDYEINWGDNQLTKQDDNGFFYLFDKLWANDHVASGTYKGRHKTIKFNDTNYYISSGGDANLKSYQIYGKSYTLSNSGFLWCDHIQSTGTDESYFLGDISLRNKGIKRIMLSLDGITFKDSVDNQKLYIGESGGQYKIIFNDNGIIYSNEDLKIYPDYINFDGYFGLDATTDNLNIFSNKTIVIRPNSIQEYLGLYFDAVSSEGDFIINKKTNYAGVSSNLAFKINDDYNGYFKFLYQNDNLLNIKKDRIEFNQDIICNTDININSYNNLIIYPKHISYPDNYLSFFASSNNTGIECDETKLTIRGNDTLGVVLEATDGILELISSSLTNIKSNNQIYIYPDFDSDANMYLNISKDSNNIKISSSSDDALKIYSNTDISILSDNQVYLYPDLDTRPTNYLKYTAGSGTLTEYCSQAFIIDSDDYLIFKSDGSTGILSDNTIELYPDFDSDPDMMLQISKSSNNVRIKSNSSGDGLDIYSSTDCNLYGNTINMIGNTNIGSNGSGYDFTMYSGTSDDNVQFSSSAKELIYTDCNQRMKSGTSIIWE